jgi:DivIVA domain-containing protein
VSEERSDFAQRIDERKFSLSRRGYDKREVRAYLEDLEQAFRELEGHARRTAQRVAELEHDLADARATEKVSVDNAMMAVFDAKDRILERARHRADEIEEQAHAEASRIKAAALAEVGSEGRAGGAIVAATAQADEIIASARREADRLRRDAEGEAARDAGAELDAVTAQLRRAHADTTAAKEQLDAARKRIVELESGLGKAPSEELEEKFAKLESLLTSARDDNARLTQEVAAREDQVNTLKAAVTAAERALDESKQYVAGVESEVDEKSARIETLEAEVTRLQTVARKVDEQAELIAEHEKAGKSADDGKVAQLEAAIAMDEEELAEARTRIAELEAQVADAAGTSAAREEAEAILAEARQEAEEIRADAEEEAEQRAAKVIAKAREEADQVRQTVTTLTAQAEDARSAALRSKLEAEDLVEAQRAMSGAADDIIAAAHGRAEEIEQAARDSAAALQKQAEEALAKADEEAERIKTEAEQRAAELVAEAEQQAAAIASGAGSSEVESGDELAAMLAEAEQELAITEELRRQRAELEQREQELAERERALAAKQQDEAASIISSREAPLRTPPEPVVAAALPRDDEDPAERLSALLAAATGTAAEDGADDDPGTGTATESGDAASAEPHPRVAWPAPNRPVESEQREAEPAAGDDEADESGEQRESRYRSRSAQLPRLGNQAKSNMTTMANLRKKSRGGS